MMRVVRRCRNVGRRVRRQCSTARLHLAVAFGEIEAVGVEIIQVRRGRGSCCAIQPLGVFTEMPMPLSSQTNSTGAGSFWYAVHAAALNAVCAVAWLLEASPNEQIAMLSSGIGSAWPMRLRLLDRDRGAQRLGQVRGDGRGLRQHPQRLAAPDLVAAAGGRIVLARGEATAPNP